MTTTTQQKLAALFAKSSTPALVTALLALEGAAPSPERNWSRAKTIEELERRFPSAGRAVERAFEAAEANAHRHDARAEDVDYVAVLVAAIPEEER